LLVQATDDSPWTSIGLDALNSTYAQGVAYDAALQGMVLLKNNGALPLAGAGLKLAVVGPMGDDSTGLKSDYEGAQDDNTDTIFAALQRANRGTTSFHLDGDQAVAAVKAADAVVLAIGLTKKQEHEGMVGSSSLTCGRALGLAHADCAPAARPQDRKDTLLPADQTTLASAVFAAAGSTKPVIVILCNGGAVSIDELVEPSHAIVEAFNPAQQGPKALAALLFGHENRWGKLPITIYDKDYASKLPIQDMEYDTPPGELDRFLAGLHGCILNTLTVCCRALVPILHRQAALRVRDGAQPDQLLAHVHLFGDG
jgi:beta-D-xylosidase 4